MFTLPIKAYKIKEQNQMRNMLKIIVRSGPGPEPLRKKLQRGKRENRLLQNLFFIHARLEQKCEDKHLCGVKK